MASKPSGKHPMATTVQRAEGESVVGEHAPEANANVLTSDVIGRSAPAGEKPAHLFLPRHLKDTRGSETSASPQPSAAAAAATIINTNIIITCGR